MIADGKQRRRAREETDRSFAVEASAGTGKTTTLVDRILHLVLEKGPKGDPVSLSQICAITFTEKAAGEMKIRLRQEFERRVGHEDPVGERARAALQDLESATVSTFHAFAVSLLKERPIEAELDPRFTALDENQGRLFFREIWEPWLNRALHERRGPLEAALRGGITLETLRVLAETLRQHSSTLRALRLTPPPGEAEIDVRRRSLLLQAEERRKLATSPDDKLVPILEDAMAWLENPACGRFPRNPGAAGAQAGWSGGKATVARVKDFVREAVEFQRSCARLPQQRLFDSVIRWLIDDFLVEWEARKRQNGFLDFDDQLAAARRLLSACRAARREFQKRYVTLLVDEFQDTDNVQLEIVLLLSSTDLAETDPRRLRPEPGRLFIVGDPKQSIYRFRGADIETYMETVDAARAHALSLERLDLTTNFRSVPSILRFVDEVFAGAMVQTGRHQPAYLSFGGRGVREAGPLTPSVHILGDRDENGGIIGSGRDFPKIEASRIARLLTWMQGSCEDTSGPPRSLTVAALQSAPIQSRARQQAAGRGDWTVEDRSSGPGTAGGSWRPVRYGDVAILLPVLTHVDMLEDALSAEGIPYVLEGGKFYYARSEVASAITVLRALANPNDKVALYGALRSIFFGLSDEDLLRAHLQGEALDYRIPAGEGSTLCRPFRILRELHSQRHERAASETLERLLLSTGAREVLATRGFQSLANLGKLARTLRTIQQDKTFSQVVEILLAMDEEGVAESESRLMEEKSDAVRILSIHRAKGLDFPVVIVAGLGFQAGNRRENFLVDLHQRKTFALKLGSQEDGFQTADWDTLLEEEKKKGDAELTRLLYVALTRARDHLVLCTHTKGKAGNAPGMPVPDYERTRLKPLADFLTGRLDEENGLVRFIDPRSLPEARSAPQGEAGAPRDWRAALHNEQAELHRLLSETPHSRLFRTPASVASAAAVIERPGETSRSRAARIGTAFHEAMEGIELLHPDTISERAGKVGTKWGLGADDTGALSGMLDLCMNSPLLQRARASARAGRRVIKELTYVRPLRDNSREDAPEPGGQRPDAVSGRPSAGIGGSEEGRIDLLFEEPDGWVLADYKTDALPGDEKEEIEAHFCGKYAGQIRCYVDALKVMNITVKAAYLLLVRAGAQIEISFAD